MTTPTAPAVRVGGNNGAGGVPPGGLFAGHGLPAAPIGVPQVRSTYLDHLPGLYQESEFLGRFLLIFEHILSPLDRTAGSIAQYFDASLTPNDFLPWLGSWLGLVVDARMPEANRRELLRAAPELYRWRGTKRGLEHFLRLATGLEPEIIEPGLSEIASSRNLAYRFTVRIRVPRGTELQRNYVESVIEAEKPAFAGYTLELVSE